MRKAILFLIICVSLSVKAQITGSAFLNSQSNHSGIKVKFNPVSPTATLDSVLTDAAGNYTSTTTGGVYKVVFSKPGYQTLWYNNANNVTLSTTSTLTNVTLFPGTVVSVSGTVSGTWTSSNVYIVNGNITIPQGDSLKILAGTYIKFNGNYSVTANGKLIANGDSLNKIYFTSNLSSPTRDDWNQISLNDSSCLLNNCVIEYCTNCIKVFNRKTDVINTEVRNFNITGIDVDCNNCSPNITHNKVHDFNVIGIQAYGSNNSTKIACNKVYNGNYGIRPYTTCYVTNNEVYNCSPGIYVAWSNPFIMNNIVHNCATGVNIQSNVTPAPYPKVIGNTLYSNSTGVWFGGNHSTGDVINNIIANNGSGIVQVPTNTSCGVCNTTPSVVAYNLFSNNNFGNFSNVQVTGIGTIVSTNSNGDPVDSYFNLFQDPLFTTAPSLNSNSPCYNAGDLTYSSLIGYDASKTCGAAAIVGIKEFIKNDVLTLFPNPTSDLIYIQTEKKYKRFEIISIDGKMVISEDIPYSNITTIDLSQLQSGIYFLRLSGDNVFSNKKIVKQ